MKMLSTIGKMLSIVLLFSIASFSSGFAINELGTRAMGQGFAFAARATDASALWYNPAGITQLEGTSIYIGTSGFSHQETYYNTPYSINVTSNNEIDILPHGYLVHQLTDKFWFGLSYNVPFSRKQEWGAPSPSNPVPYEVSNADVKIRRLSSVVAYKVSPTFSIAAGINYNMTSFILDHYDNIDTQVAALTNGVITDVDDMLIKLDFSESSISFTAGAHWKPSQSVSAGITYHSGINLELESNNIEFIEPVTGNPQLDAALASAYLDSPDIEGIARVGICDRILAGLAIAAGPNIDLELDVIISFWSRYEELALQLFRVTGTGSRILVAEDNTPKEWTDTIGLNLGAEFRATDYLALRFGLFFESNPVPDLRIDEFCPDSDRLGLSAGLGYKVNDKISIDLAYMLTFLSERDTGQSGPNGQSYESTEHHNFAISLGYIF